MKEDYGPLSNAYAFGSIQYKLLYYAANQYFLHLEHSPDSETLANQLGISEQELLTHLERLLTNNADPDRE